MWRSSQKEKDGILYSFYCPKEIILAFVFYLYVQCFEYTFRIYVLLHIKKHYFIHFLACFQNRRKSSVYPEKRFPDLGSSS